MSDHASPTDAGPFDFDSFIRKSQADAERMHEARLRAAEACETIVRQRLTIVLRHDLAVRLYKMLGRLPTAYEAGEFHAERLCGLVAMLREGGLTPESWDIRPDPRPSMASAQGEMLAACSLWGLAVAGERDAVADRLRQLFEVPDHGQLASAFYHWLTDQIMDKFDEAVGLINPERMTFEEAAARLAAGHGGPTRGLASNNAVPGDAGGEPDPVEEPLIEVLNDPPPSPSAPKPSRNVRDEKETLAIALLFKFGANAQRIAKEVGVKRTTLLGWRYFAAAYKRTQEQEEKSKRSRPRGRRVGDRDFVTDDVDDE